MSDLRIIPSIEQLRQRDGVRALERDFGREAIVDALRQEAAALRAAILSGPSHGPEGLLPAGPDEAAALLEDRARRRLDRQVRPSLRPVVNATGVVVHTNLGRAPLPDLVAERVREVTGYSNLEYDLVRGGRGRRDVHAEALLCRLLGVEAALVVNNNAAATLLLLAALAAGREVIVSRGELVEIGGGFRVPDVMAQSGARLREVGTTNKTRIEDYRAAVSADTGLLLRVHRSNFRIEGFTEQPSLAELAALGRELGITVAEDLGSGYLGLCGEEDPGRLDAVLGGEPRVQDSLAAGIDILCFSGDKLLGGPQAGIVVGRRALVDSLRRHPLLRALRVDKLTYAALEATLGEYAAGRASRTIPVLRMVLLTPAELRARIEAVRAHVGRARELRPGGLRLEVVEGASAVGGGTTPGLEIPTVLLGVGVEGRSAAWVEDRLRTQDPPVLGRIERDRFVLDIRTVLPKEDELVAAALVNLAAAV
jgi:L-seryl-tRNA(Ser) seleniumtransferase